MTSKFFTWTKGDRKHAVEALTAGGVIPIPVECLSFKGLDPRRTPKLGILSTSPDDKLKSPTTIALHDPAVVESAASLMTLIHGLLKAPQASAHVSHMGQSLLPPAGRPRSRTAPSTPRFEAPAAEPVELLGSVPPTPLRYRHSEESVTQAAPLNAAMTDMRNVEAKGTAMMQSTPLLPTPRSSADSGIDMTRSDSYQVVSPFVVSPMKTLPSVLRPPLVVEADPRTCDPAQTQDENALPQDDVESVLLHQISSMRASHEAHVRSLKHAHETEVSSHLSYIAFLEQRQLEKALCAPLRLAQESQSELSPDTAPSELPGSLAISPPLKSFEQTRNDAQVAVLEAESLRRNISLIRKEQVEAVELRKQRDQMQDTLEHRDQRIIQLKRALKQARETERTQRNLIEGLHARALAANDQRLDALAGFYITAESLNALETAKRSLKVADPTSEILTADEASSESVHFRSAKRHATDDCTSFEHVTSNDLGYVSLAELRQVSSAPTGFSVSAINELTQGRAAEHSEYVARLRSLQDDLELTQRALSTAGTERDQYYALLQNEMRRQARQAVPSLQLSPAIEAEASNRVQSMVLDIRAKMRSSTSPSIGTDGEVKSIPGLLEKELEHCIHEIIMYKLDVKGYRKDLREARAQIEVLQAMTNRPATPPSNESKSRLRASRNSDTNQRDGLGITVSYAPVTPPRPTTHALYTHSVSPTSSFASLTPQHRPKTPLSVHKRLPEPPPLLPDLRTGQNHIVPGSRVLRADALRSLSDSVIIRRDHMRSPKSRPTPSMADANLSFSAL